MNGEVHESGLEPQPDADRIGAGGPKAHRPDTGGSHAPGPPPGKAKHPSLEKTDRDLRDRLGNRLKALEVEETQDAQAAARSTRSADIGLLREELDKKTRECAALLRAAEHLRIETETLRSDFAVQRSEHMSEIQALREIVKKAQEEATRLRLEIASLKQDNKSLKAQNLGLQYHLNAWGIPVCSGEESAPDLGGVDEEGKTFFPALTPLQGSEDPIPVILRGDLSALSFPDLLTFLANSKLSGVVTVLGDGIVAKLYLEGPILRISGWNNRDPDLGLLALLRESELVPREVCDAYRDSDLYDLGLAAQLVTERELPPDTIRLGLKEHSRIILSYLFHMERGTFYFQPGQIPRRRDLQFDLPITDVLLKTAAEMDERTREFGEVTAT